MFSMFNRSVLSHVEILWFFPRWFQLNHQTETEVYKSSSWSQDIWETPLAWSWCWRRPEGWWRAGEPGGRAEPGGPASWCLSAVNWSQPLTSVPAERGNILSTTINTGLICIHLKTKQIETLSLPLTVWKGLFWCETQNISYSNLLSAGRQNQHFQAGNNNQMDLLAASSQQW